MTIPEQLHLQAIAGFQIVGVTQRHELDGVAERRLPVVRSFFADLENGFDVLGIFLHGFFAEGVVLLTPFEHVEYAVMLEVFVELFGGQFDVVGISRHPGNPGARFARPEVQDGDIVQVRPLRGIGIGASTITDQADVLHTASGDDIFALVEGAVEELDSGGCVRLKKEGSHFQEHVVAAEQHESCK